MKIGNVNQNYLKCNHSFKLRKIGVSLALTTSIIVATGCTNKNSFIYKEGMGSFSTQYESEIGYDIPLNEEEIVNKLSNYSIAYNDYIADTTSEEKRFNLISQTNNMIDVAYELVSQKIKNSIGLDNRANIIITVDAATKMVIVKIEDEYGRELYKIDQKMDPILDIINNCYYLSSLKNTEKNTFIDNDIDNYSNNSQELYNNIINIIDIELEYLDNKFVIKDGKNRSN